MPVKCNSAPILYVATIAFLFVTMMTAQVDSTESIEDPQEVNPLRKVNTEFIIGAGFTEYVAEWGPGTRGWYGQSGLYTARRTYFTVGFGAHIPITKVGRLGTIWFVPAGTFGVSAGPKSDGVDKAVSLDFCAPLHVTFGIGALRRRSIAWGVEAGLGLTLSKTSAYDAFALAPSAMVDISYAPRSIYRLRLMTHLIPISLLQGTYRRYSVAFIWGL